MYVTNVVPTAKARPPAPLLDSSFSAVDSKRRRTTGADRRKKAKEEERKRDMVGLDSNSTWYLVVIMGTRRVLSQKAVNNRTIERRDFMMRTEDKHRESNTTF